MMTNFVWIFILVALQLFLCSRNKRWLGLVLPGIYLVLSIRNTVYIIQSGIVSTDAPMTIAVAFITYNLDTLLLLFIYLLHRRFIKR